MVILNYFLLSQRFISEINQSNLKSSIEKKHICELISVILRLCLLGEWEIRFLHWTGGITLQNRYGSPVYPIWHEHDGLWLTTWQLAFWPQVPGHGSWHLFRTHCNFEGQSELMMHSGRHPSYGFPTYSVRHWHEPTPFCSRHTAFDPHGLGTQGVRYSVGTSAIFVYWEKGHVYG